MSADKVHDHVQVEVTSKEGLKEKQGVERDRPRRFGMRSSKPFQPSTERQPLVEYSKVNGTTDVERRGVLRQNNEENGPRKKTTAQKENAQKQHIPDYKRYPFTSPLEGIDGKYADNPQYAARIAWHIRSFQSTYEKQKLIGKGKPLKAPKNYIDLKEYRTRAVSVIFNKGYQFRVPTDTLHLAVYYLDRFLEKYTGADYNSTAVGVTALHLASKFEDVEPLYLDEILRSSGMRSIRESDVLKLEVIFFNLLHVLLGTTTTAFATRYLHAVDRETFPAEGHTARYLCALSVCHFPFTGHYYSKIAAAAVFIAHNKYSTTENVLNPVYEYPPALEKECGYTLAELKPLVMEMVKLVQETECMVKQQSKKMIPPSAATKIYERYEAVGVATGYSLPDFKPFFEAYEVDTVKPMNLKNSEDDSYSAPAEEPASETAEVCTSTPCSSSVEDDDDTIDVHVPVTLVGTPISISTAPEDDVKEQEDVDDGVETDSTASKEN